jgi:hypothetical protein
MQAASQAAQASTACKDLTLTSGKTLAVALAVIGYAQTLWLATQHDKLRRSSVKVSRRKFFFAIQIAHEEAHSTERKKKSSILC